MHQISFYNLWLFLLFLVALILSIFSLHLAGNNYSYFLEFHLCSINSTEINFILFLDYMSVIFISLVLFISGSVSYFSKEYMMNLVNQQRFILLIILFVTSMLLMILSPNLVSILLGWDGLGLISYCLVIFFQNVKSSTAGMLTILSNRVGDILIILSIAWAMSIGSYSFVFWLNVLEKNNTMQLIMFMILLSAMTKSAQIPFSAWLPAAMAAPTPVSALVHSSTLVTAGVYLMIRFSPMIFYSNFSLILLTAGMITMFMAGVGAAMEMDLKKIIAYSTLSQLGLMMSTISINFFKLAFFHLLMHALFKSLLFLCAGVFIHNFINFQDIRITGNYFNQLPLTSVCFNISSMALCGIPFMAGFYSKDLILENLMMSNINIIVLSLFIVSTLFTVIYSVRLITNVNLMTYSTFSLNLLSEKKGPMLNSMKILSLMSIVGGSIFSWMMFPLVYLIFLPIMMKLLVLCVIFLGVFLSLSIFSLANSIKTKYFVGVLFSFSSSIWFLQYLTTNNIIKVMLNQSNFFQQVFSFGWSEICGANHMKNSIIFLMKSNSNINSNQINIFLISYLILLFFIYWCFFM